MQDNRATIEFESFVENIGFARVSAVSFASSLEFTLEELEDIKLSVSEAVSNCVVHAYPDSHGPVKMELEVSDGAYKVAIEDQGVGIEDVDIVRRPGFTTSPEHMGMGLTLMEALSDHLLLSSQAGVGTRVVMKFVPRRARGGD